MSSKNFDKYLELSKQRAKSFEKMKSNIEELRLKIENAGSANKKQAAKESDVDVANKWRALEMSNARAKGYNSGYAEACSHITPILVDLASSVDDELLALQELYDKIINVKEDADEDSTDTDDLDPLG